MEVLQQACFSWSTLKTVFSHSGSKIIAKDKNTTKCCGFANMQTARYAGAGDIVAKEVKKVPYYTYSLSYTFEGKEYKCVGGGYFSTVEKEKGTQMEIVIDSSNPEYVITGGQSGKSDSFMAWMYLSRFLIVLLIWFIRRFRIHK